MPTRDLLQRVEKVEQCAKEIAQARSMYSPECICFPENEPPSFGFPLEQQIASGVKCPLHGNRWKWTFHRIYVSKWLREGFERKRETLSPQHRKAWAASFPPNLWPAVEEEAEEGIYLRLKDGTRLLADEHVWKKNQGQANGVSDLSADGEQTRTASSPGTKGLSLQELPGRRFILTWQDARKK
jgi:hypothetical protein